jgi:hypothetical protein
MALGLAACASFGGSSDRSRHEAGGSGQQMVDDENPNYYYDFEDVIVPGDMKLEKDQSFVVETMQAKTGVLTFAGRVDSASLADFYKNNMGKDGWRLRSIMRSKRSVLVFEKGDKDCVILITDAPMDTVLEIWVAPRAAAGAAGKVPSGSSAGTPAGPGYQQSGGYQQGGQGPVKAARRPYNEQNLGN